MHSLFRIDNNEFRQFAQNESDTYVLVVQCAKCSQKYALPEQAAGTKKECRKCGEPIDVPRRKYDLPVPTQQKSASLPKLNYPNASRPSNHSRNPFFHIGPPVLAMSAGATIITIAFLATRPLWYAPPVAPQPPEALHQNQSQDTSASNVIDNPIPLPTIELPDPGSIDTN